MSSPNQTWSLFLTLWLRHKELFHQTAESFDLSPSMAAALLRLRHPRTMQQLARQLHCDKSNVTAISRRLTARKLATIAPDPDDARRKCLELTSAGRKLRADLKRKLTTPPATFDSLSPTERKQLHAILGKIAGDH